jgi:hypothetical protein
MKFFICISKWFQNNQLVLNLNKTCLVKFASSKSPSYPLHVSYNKQALTVTHNIKFLGLYLDCCLTRKSHINNLIKKLNSICFMLRKLFFIVNAKMLRTVYFMHFHSQISYGIIFWGSSSSMRNVFIIQKRAVRTMLRLGPRSSCREGLKKLDILTVPCLYIYALMLFAVKNPNIYQTNSSVHGRIQSNKIHYMYLLLDSPQYKEVYFTPLLKYLTNFHKIYLNFIIIYMYLRFY